MRFLYSIFYSLPINLLVRSLLYPFRSILPTALKIPIRGEVAFYAEGEKIKILSNESSHLTKYLYWNDADAFEYTPLFYNLIRSSDCFLDVGSNFGYYSLIAGKLNPKCKIYAFEPSRGPLYFLKKNVELNNLEGVVNVVDYAVSDSQCTLTFTEYRHSKYPYLEKQISALGNLGTKNVNMPSEKYQVNSIDLDSFCFKNSIRPDLIKIDTEGNESSVFLGGRDIISNSRPLIITEVLESLDTSEIGQLISNLNYKIFDITDDQPVSVSSFEELRGKKLDVLLVPNEKLDSIQSYLS